MTDQPPLLHIDLGSPVPVYRQIANGLRTLLVSGALPEGSRFSTTRELAVDLGVHRNTVAEAYRILSDEGWLELRRRNGVTVLSRTRRRPDADAPQRWNRRLNELVAEGLAEGLSAATLAGALAAALSELESGHGGEEAS